MDIMNIVYPILSIGGLGVVLVQALALPARSSK